MTGLTAHGVLRNRAGGGAEAEGQSGLVRPTTSRSLYPGPDAG